MLQTCWQRPGYTLRELLAVVTLLCLLLAIIVPSVRSARENAQRLQCSNNLKQTGLSLQNYHDVFRQFPFGALHSGIAAEGDPPINAALGPSWWYGLIPFQQKGALYDQLQLAQQAGGTEFTADAMTAAGLPAGLPPGESVRMADCADGLSNTMIVAEQSDWLRDRNRASRHKYRGDAGWTVGGTGAGGGFLSGTRRVDPVPEVIVPGGPPSPWDADCWNITVVRYPPNRQHVLGPSPLPGCSENHGINNPLQSAHRGGFFVALVDGSVHFIEDGTDLEVLLRLAIRNDNRDYQDDPTAPPDDSP